MKGGGFVTQIYVILQSISKVLAAYCQKYVDEASKKENKDILIQYDWPLLEGDPCRCESRKFKGHGAHAQVMVPMLNTRNPTDKPISRKIRVHPCSSSNNNKA